MKVLCILSTLLFATLSQASSYMKVTKNSGYVMPENRYSLNCEITTTGTSWQKVFGADNQQHNLWKPLLFTAKIKNLGDAKKAIQSATKGKIIKLIGPADGATSQYTGILEGEVVSRHVKILFDFSETKLLNSIQRAREDLVEFSDANCPLDFEE